MASEEVVLDLIRVNLLNILQWVSIEETEFSKLSPFQKTVKELADKYGVPSPFAKAESAIVPPPVPEGKVRNGV